MSSPDDWTQAQRDAFAMFIAERMDKAIQNFMGTLFPEFKYVMVVGSEEKSGAVFTNFDTDAGREQVINYLSTALNKVRS